MDAQRIETIVRERLAARGDVAAAYLYGSRARGEARADSDVDLALLYREPAPSGLAALSLPLEGELERALGLQVQVVALNSAAPDLVHRVLRDGVLLVEHDASQRVAFEVRLRNEYFDLLPYLREYRQGPA